LLWLLNGCIVALVLARMLVFGEPVTSAKETNRYWRHIRQADADLAASKF